MRFDNMMVFKTSTTGTPAWVSSSSFTVCSWHSFVNCDQTPHIELASPTDRTDSSSHNPNTIHISSLSQYRHLVVLVLWSTGTLCLTHGFHQPIFHRDWRKVYLLRFESIGDGMHLSPGLGYQRSRVLERVVLLSSECCNISFNRKAKAKAKEKYPWNVPARTR